MSSDLSIQVTEPNMEIKIDMFSKKKVEQDFKNTLNNVVQLKLIYFF